VRTSPDHSFQLATGATRLLHVDEGVTLVVVRGRVKLNDAQLWLLERAWTPSVELAEGDARLCDRAGWFRVDASSDCEVLMAGFPAQGPAASLFEGIIRRWRTAFGRTVFS
jgi:hypothetical protein